MLEGVVLVMVHLSLLLHLDEFGDAIVHLLDGIVFGETHAPLVGDVVDAALGFGVFTAGAADLEVVLAGNLVELGLVGGELGYLDVHGGTDSGSQVGWAEGEETKPVIMGEGHTLLDLVDGAHQTAVYFTKISTHLHGNDAEMVLLVAPDQEGLAVVVVDATAAGPVAASVGGLEETITLLEEEVVVDELLLDILTHTGQWEEGTLEITFKSGEGRGNLLFHFLVLVLGQAGVEGVSLHGAAATDTGGDDVLTSRVQIAESVDITPVLGRVLVGLLESTMVVLDDGVEQVSEDGVSFGIRCVDSYTRVVIFQA